STAYLADGGFERTDFAVGWDWDPTTQTGVDSSPGAAHSGAQAMTLFQGRGCATRQVTFPVTVPPSTATAGPALQFFYKAPALTTSRLSVSANDMSSGDLPAATTYRQAQLCLDSTWTGQNV